MPRNTGEGRVRRAAGMIAFLWGRHKKHSAEVYTLSEAAARAANHEKGITDEQLAYAVRWAKAAHAFSNMANSKGNGKTLGELRDESGLTYYSNRDNWPRGE